VGDGKLESLVSRCFALEEMKNELQQDSVCVFGGALPVCVCGRQHGLHESTCQTPRLEQNLGAIDKGDAMMLHTKRKRLPRSLGLPVFACGFALAAFALVGCGGGQGKTAKSGGSSGKEKIAAVGYEFPVEAGKYTILGIQTDNKDSAIAKSRAEDTLTKHPDIACMVGLWAYNPPTILSAVKDAGKVGKVVIVGFDEDKETLKGIAAGEIHGTVVQQPFVFGYKSVEYLSALARGQEVKVPESKMIYIPITIVNKKNVEEFGVTVENMKAGKGKPPEHDRDDYDTSQKVRIAFMTNSVDPFWSLAQDGVKLAEPVFNAECQVLMPPSGTVEEQKQYIESLISSKCEGLAISPIDPKNQVKIIDDACAVMPVIAQDSDAPETQRKFYIGTSNYLAGREAGKLVKEAVPKGGKVMIFVGKLEVLNAQERSKGVIDELLGKPIPEEFATQ
jgi:ribose transport system substrate-binding protein